MTGIATRQNAVAAALSAGGCHSTCELAVVTGLRRNEVAATCCRLVSRDWIVRRARGCFEMTAVGRAAIAAGETITSGPSGPLTQSEPRRPRRRTERDRVWATIRIAGKFTIASIEELAGASRENARRYVRDLERAGYLAPLRPEPGGAPTSNGFKRWTLIDDTGFEAPVATAQRKGLYDRNRGELRPFR